MCAVLNDKSKPRPGRQGSDEIKQQSRAFRWAHGNLQVANGLALTARDKSCMLADLGLINAYKPVHISNHHFR
jgi:hypothetical protein